MKPIELMQNEQNRKDAQKGMMFVIVVGFIMVMLLRYYGVI